MEISKEMQALIDEQNETDKKTADGITVAAQKLQSDKAAQKAKEDFAKNSLGDLIGCLNQSIDEWNSVRKDHFRPSGTATKMRVEHSSQVKVDIGQLGIFVNVILWSKRRHPNNSSLPLTVTKIYLPELDGDGLLQWHLNGKHATTKTLAATILKAAVNDDDSILDLQ
ncbi:MAG TPA: hypothetical protein V6C97_09620 [Oculatellaceae cyanobacterium]